jgi:hypothetical protein
MRIQRLAMLLLVVGLGACGGGGGDHGRGGQSDDAGPTTPSHEGLSCAEVVDCLSACPTSNDATCENTCISRASSDATDAILDLATCIQMNACSDEACVLANCEGELETCGLDTTGGHS